MRKDPEYHSLTPDGFPSKYIPHVPHPKQQAFLLLPVLEALFGGAAGGGKSDTLLMSALQYVDVPGYSALLMRKTFAELKLPGALMDRASQWLAGKARWNDNDKQWTFESGATLTFGYLQTANDRLRYQSAEFQFIGFDELTEFDRLDYTFMFSRLRRNEGVNVPLRMRGATNPGGPGHEWVRKRFIDKIPEEDEDPEDVRQRLFLPSRLDDNPSIDKPMYMRSLTQLDEAWRKMLIDGDWDAREPGEWMIPDQRWIDAAIELGERLDLMREAGKLHPRRGHLSGCVDWGEITQAYAIWPLENLGVYVPPSEVKGEHDEPGETSVEILVSLLKFGLPILDVRYDSAGIQSMRTFVKTMRGIEGLQRVRSTKIPFNQYKKQTIGYLRMLFRNTFKGNPTRIIGISPENKELIRQLRRWERKDEESEDAVKRDDHGPDALVAGCAPYARRWRDEQIEARLKAYGVKTPTALQVEKSR